MAQTIQASESEQAEVANVELCKKALQTWPSQLAYSAFESDGTYCAVGHMIHVAGWDSRSKDAQIVHYLNKLGIGKIWSKIAGYSDEHYEEPELVRQFVANLLGINLDEE